MTRDIALSVVFPAYNEAARLPRSLSVVYAYLAASEELTPAEVLVVDDGSTDGTAAAAAAVTTPAGIELRLITLAANRGKGAAVREGLRATRGLRVLISDADLATPIDEVEALAASGADLAVGSRALRRELISVRQPLPRDYLGRAFNLYLRLLGLTRMRDTQCGFKLLNGELARRLATRLRLDRFAFDVELLARARRMGAAIVEVPVRWHHVEASRVRALRDGLRMGWDVLRLRWWLWFGG